MSPDTSFGIGTPAALRESSARRNVRLDGCLPSDILTLNSLALRSLSWLFDEKEQLFCERVTLGKDGYRRGRVSRKHTVVALLGLHHFGKSGETSPFDTKAIENAVLQDRSWVKSAGELGLSTWLAAVGLSDQLDTILDEFSSDRALSSYADGRAVKTSGLAWLLAGIAHAALAQPARTSELTDVAVDIYRLLRDNQSQGGLFGHAASARSPRGVLWGRFGTFYDQISAIYALSIFAKAFQVEEPLESALACANSICALQGDLGQWWSLYDKRTGCVVNRYPVLSAYQDGIAPCALLALGEATGRSFHHAIRKGLSWITETNELGVDLRIEDRGLIWDSIDFDKRSARYWDAVLGFVNVSRHEQASKLKIRCEARPDHFGWLLYAFGEVGLPNGRSLAAHA
ncbi:MAG: hypothetical protein WA369_05215 [Candidatus Acidiferrales bacterium]